MPGRVLGSDPHAFASLYIRHRSSFTSHARRYLRDPRDADEVVQEAFLRLFLALPELETELQALAYCRRTITNLCIDRYRADARRPRLVALDGATVDELAEDETGDPVVRAEDAAVVREALSQLPPLHRAALVKREIEEKSLPVIAGELDVAEDSVKHLLFRARRALRKLLAGTSVAPGADAELARGLRPAARGASGGAAGLLLLALLGLGSGPDLRAVPVVGVDLPDVLGVTAVAEAVGDAVRGVVGVVVPGNAGHDAASASQLSSEPVSRTQVLSQAAGSVPTAAQQRAGSPPVGGSAAGSSAVTPGGMLPGPSAGERATRVVTMVDGVPVVSVLPPTGVLPSVYAPLVGSRPTAVGTSTGRGPGVLLPTWLPTLLPPLLPANGRDVAGGAPVGPVLPAADAPSRPSGPATSGRSPRTDDAAHAADKAAEKAADKAAKAEAAAERTADKAVDVAEKAQEKAGKVVEQATVKAEQAADRAAARVVDKAADKADKAAEKTQKAAEKAAAQAAAERTEAKAVAQKVAAQRAAAERAAAERAAAARAAAERAAAVAAAAQAAERAAAQTAAALAAEQAAATAPVSAVPTAVSTTAPTAVPVPTP